jgi:MerR family transcriptional regulator, mercuric resistance operon regulatory protein
MASQNSEFYIGTVAEKTGVKVETIRYYEKAGVIRPPIRGENGYRLYSTEHVERLEFVKRCRELGFSLENTSSLLSLSDSHNRTCKQVSEIAEERLNDVCAKIADLRRMEVVLKKYVEACPRNASAECPIISALSDAV